MAESPNEQRLLRLHIVKDIADIFEQRCRFHFGEQNVKLEREIKRMHEAHRSMLDTLRSISASLSKMEEAEEMIEKEQNANRERVQQALDEHRKQDEEEDQEDDFLGGMLSHNAAELAQQEDETSEASMSCEHEPPLTVWENLQEFMESGYFGMFSSFIIFLNAGQIAVETELMLHCTRANPGEGTGCSVSPAMTTVNSLFFAFYSLECCAKLVIHGREFFIGPDRGWHLFDLLLVLTGVFDTIEQHVMTSDSGINMTWMRMLRLLKMLKMLRMVRLMESFRELRVMLASMLGAVRITFWALTTLSAIMFFFTICFLQGIAGYLGDTPASEMPLHLIDILDRRFGSIGTSMESLFLAVTGGMLWEELKLGLVAAGQMYYLLLVSFMGFTLFAVLNVINGICCSAAVAIEQHDYESVVNDLVENNEALVKQLKQKLKDMDKDGDGNVSWHEIVQQFQDEDAVRFMSALSITQDDAMRLFKLLQKSHGKSRIPVNDFVDSCVKLKGGAKSIDVVCLLSMMGKMSKDARKTSNEVYESLATLTGHVETLLAKRPGKQQRQLATNKGSPSKGAAGNTS